MAMTEANCFRNCLLTKSTESTYVTLLHFSCTNLQYSATDSHRSLAEASWQLDRGCATICGSVKTRRQNITCEHFEQLLKVCLFIRGCGTLRGLFLITPLISTLTYRYFTVVCYILYQSQIRLFKQQATYS